MEIKIPVSIGELVDKISILEIKLRSISNNKKLKNIKKEYDSLNYFYIKIFNQNKNIEKYLKQIRDVNLIIWNLQEISKEKIEKKIFDDEYIEITTKIHNNNDLRFEIKSKINKEFKSNYFEEKSYRKYD